jgi:hypothetical protein
MSNIYKIQATQRFKGSPKGPLGYQMGDTIHVEAVNAKWALERAIKHYKSEFLEDENSGKKWPCVDVQVVHLEKVIDDFLKL